MKKPILMSSIIRQHVTPTEEKVRGKKRDVKKRAASCQNIFFF